MDSISPTATMPEYSDVSDLSQLCLPRTYKDSNRRLAWVNSICCLFLAIGLVGLKPPKIVVRPITPPTELMPVELPPVEEQPKVVNEEKPPEDEMPPEAAPEVPVVATVVAPDAKSVAFAVPVTGPVVIAPPRYAAPPPPPTQPKATIFVPGQGERGSFPWPGMPREAYERHITNCKLMLYVEVDANGVPSRVETRDSSGYSFMDRWAEKWVKDHWRWLPGSVRLFYVPWEIKWQ